jgi:transglutaminase-like putative cysteine protease
LSFGPDAPVGQLWETSNATAVTIQRSPTDDGKYYWRTYVYDEIDFKGFRQTDSSTVEIAPDARVLDQTADDVGPIGRRSDTFTVTPVEFHQATILSPETPIDVDQGVRRTTIGTSGYFATLDRLSGNGAYTVTALTLVDGNSPGQLNQTDLRAAGQAYPDEVKRLYLSVEPDVIGSNTQALEKTIEARAGSTNPFDLAHAAVDVLQHDPFQYSTDIRGLPCQSKSDVECFATYKKGFCQYYAATMAVILRDLGVPTRIAEGFLPGARDANSTIERIPFSNAHAWVEVYFPGYGWVTFDPTGGNRSQLAPIPSGPPAASASARSSGGPLPTIRVKPDLGGGASGSAGSLTPPSRPLGPLLAVGLLLLLVVILLAVIAWRRGPRGPTSADGAYGTVVRIASRFGFGPRPAQTVYEYASTLGDVLPTVRPELETVAKAKVESIYAREILGQERLDTLRAAQRRLRVGLLRLAFRRKQRRKH